ncbi:MAG: ParB/RepB/Spo0J family partition protein [Propionibacteriaceae bacterium]|jgi:ParB family chromosome partitioning protein|nr:ParB/RepB/Spo0J family partition protein [Propionibacteriaceae bacterium]
MAKPKGLTGVALKRRDPTAAKSLADAIRERDSLSGYQTAPLAAVAANPRNPQARSMSGIDELAASVAEVGVLQPVLLAPAGEWLATYPQDADAVGAAEWVALDGHRRLAAARRAGLSEIPYVERSTALDETLVRLHTSGHSMRLTPLEEARAYRHLIEQRGIKRVDIAKHAAVSPSHVTKRLKLLDLPDAVGDAVDAGLVDINEALNLAAAEPAVQDRVARQLSRNLRTGERPSWTALLRDAQARTAAPAPTRAPATPPEPEPPTPDASAPPQPVRDALAAALAANASPAQVQDAMATALLHATRRNRRVRAAARQAGLPATAGEWEALAKKSDRLRAGWIAALVLIDEWVEAGESGPLTERYLGILHNTGGYTPSTEGGQS